MGVPANPIIVCGSGPSLTAVPYLKLGLPLAAISTAIKFVPAPRHWLLVDRVNRAHEREGANPNHVGPGGPHAFSDDAIEKVVPASRKKYFQNCTNLTPVLRDKATPFMGGDKDHLHYCFNRSMLFACEWLSWRYDCLIFTGCDLQVNPKQQFVTHRKARSRVNSRNHGHRIEFKHWESFAPIAEERGVLWLNWTPGGPLGSLMEGFDDWRRRHSGHGEDAWLHTALQPATQRKEPRPASPRMAGMVCKTPLARHTPSYDPETGGRNIR